MTAVPMERSSLIVPAPGIYPDTPNHVYHGQWDAASNSKLSKLRQSPAHLRSYLTDPPESTTALVLGSAVHCAILEPDDFAKRYARAPELDMRTKIGKETFAALELQYGPDRVLKSGEYDTCLKVRDAVFMHSSAARLLAAVTARELSIVWVDPETGLTCKARYDGHAPEVDGGVIIDIKTTRDASKAAFKKSIFSLGYHRQGAFYLDGGVACDIQARHYVIIAAEKEGPCAVAAYRLREDAIEAGNSQIRPLLRRYKECKDTNTYPGYPDEVVDISLPPWAWRQVDDEVAESVV